MPVAQERTGWRDEEISRRHRKWGVGCTATDIDFLLIEYEHNCPKAIIEYKHEFAPPQYASNAQYQTLINLGNMAKILIIACRYSDDFSHYKVVALNEYAKKFIPERADFDEIGWVSLLYKIRGHEVTPEFLKSMEVEI